MMILKLIILNILIIGLNSKSLNICFYSNQACERGTEIALFDYAHYAGT